jgi:hypothetical protein
VPRDSTDSRAQAAWLAAIAEPTCLLVLRALAAGVRSVTDLVRS